jgi:hypothetical protein
VKHSREDHFRPDEGEHDRQPLAEVGESLHRAGQDEVQGAQPEDRERVGGEDDEQVCRHPEGRRDRIDGKYHVRRCHGDQRGEQGGRGKPAIAPGEEPHPVVVLACRQDLAEATRHEVWPRVGRHAAAQREGAKNAGEEHPVLIGGGHGEGPEEQRENEKVVDGQCLLDEVGGEVLSSGAPALPRNEEKPERGACGHPCGADQHRCPHARLAPVREQVDGEQAKDRAPACRPHPTGGARHRLSRRRRRKALRWISRRQQITARPAAKISHEASASRWAAVTSASFACAAVCHVKDSAPGRTARAAAVVTV